MAIQHKEEFIELIERNTLETKKDIWLWFSRYAIPEVLILAIYRLYRVLYINGSQWRLPWWPDALSRISGK